MVAGGREQISCDSRGGLWGFGYEGGSGSDTTGSWVLAKWEIGIATQGIEYVTIIMPDVVMGRKETVYVFGGYHSKDHGLN
mmetsp:Transcript_26011/g.26430  ORF Transcript_26011/g.26430 Transcript_26011/m.26430 type:complete len:81 (+) Transcript_26011:196-438(+)